MYLLQLTSPWLECEGRELKRHMMEKGRWVRMGKGGMDVTEPYQRQCMVLHFAEILCYGIFSGNCRTFFKFPEMLTTANIGLLRL